MRRSLDGGTAIGKGLSPAACEPPVLKRIMQTGKCSWRGERARPPPPCHLAHFPRGEHEEKSGLEVS